MPKSEKVWKLITEERLQLWPKDTQQTYLTPPTKFFPKEAMDCAGVKIPKGKFASLLGGYGIVAAACTNHRGEYYVSRGGSPNYTVAFLVSCRKYRFGADGKKCELGAGSCVMVPPNTPFETRAEKAKAVWFEAADSPFWRAAFGDKPICRKCGSVEDVAFLFSMYARELYAENASLSVLQNTAKLIVEFVRREFASETETDAVAFRKLADKIGEDLSENWTLARACAEAGIARNKLTSIFGRECGCTFSKYLRRARMEAAAEMLACGMPLAQIARKTGFSDGHALSFAFKNHCGYSPSDYVSHKRPRAQ